MQKQKEEKKMHRRESSMIDTTTTTNKVSQRRTPSFSSTLLDTIYRSIDEPSHGNYVKKQSKASMEGDIKVSSLKRAIMIENWVEKQSIHGSSVHFNSTSSSSDSSNGGVFSSSEAESIHKEKSRRSKHVKLEKPITNNQEKAKQESTGGFNKTKLKALKIYGELKKVKQPISPGGRITNFLNSIFNANSKKVNICSNGVSGDVNFQRKSKSTASSPTSFTRSCLSKTPTSRGNNNNKKRSVKFCPVSVIVDEDCRPCGHKFIYEEDPKLMSNIKVSSRKEKEKSGIVSSSLASEYLRSYHQRKGGIGKMNLRGFIEDYDDDDDDDGDALSCSSSDLFELDHLRIGRYREELPVYETTRFKTNQAIW